MFYCAAYLRCCIIYADVVILPFVCWQVVDISARVHALYYHLDPVVLEVRVTEVWYNLPLSLTPFLRIG